MKYLAKKDKLNRLKFSNTELDHKVNKFLFINLLNSNKFSYEKQNLLHKYFLLNKNNKYKTKILRRCVLTNRSKVSNSIFGISRIKLRNLLKENQITGFSKKVW